MTPFIYNSHQEACQFATPSAVYNKKWVYKITPAETKEQFCRGILIPGNWRQDYYQDCINDPNGWGFFPLVKGKIELFECVPSPAYSIEPRQERM